MNQEPIWGRFMKKTRGQKSRATVPLIIIITVEDKSCVRSFHINNRVASAVSNYGLGTGVRQTYIYYYSSVCTYIGLFFKRGSTQFFYGSKLLQSVEKLLAKALSQFLTYFLKRKYVSNNCQQVV